MKKALSFFMVLSMLLGITALVPFSASSEEAEAAAPASGRVYYENDFDDLNSSLSSDELIKAIGWGEAAGADQTVSVTADGQLRIVSKYTKEPGSKSWADAHTYPVAKDENIRTSATVIEYDMTYQRNTADTYGQSGVQGASFRGGTVRSEVDGAAHDMYWYTNIRSSGVIDNYFRDDTVGGSGGWNNELYSTLGASAYATPTAVTYEHNDGQFDTPNEGESIYGQRIHVKITIDRYDGISVFMNGVLVSTLRSSGISKWNNNYADRLLSDEILLYVKPGMDVLLDNLKIYEYVPELVISEVMVAAAAYEGANHEWIEVYNNTTSPINVYDYCLVRDTQPWVAAQGLGSNGKDFAYLYPGSHTYSYYAGPNDASYVYQATHTNPAYEEGVLQPGESAMLLIPTNSIGYGTAGNPATLDTFRSYIQNKLGYDGDVRVFIAYSDYNFSLNNTNIVLYATAKVTNAGSDYAENYKPVCAAEGDWNTNYAHFVNYVLACHDPSKTVISMFGMDFPCVPAHAVDSSVEFSCYDEEGNVTRRGNMRYGVQDARGERKATNSAGTIPEDCRRAFKITTVGMNGALGVQLARLATDFTPADGAPVQNYRFVGWADENGAPVTVIPNVMESHTIYAVYESLLPEFTGYQTTSAKDGVWGIRFVSVLNHIECAAIGYRLEFSYNGADYEKDIRCQYVYTSITQTVDGAQDAVTAEELGGAYIFALHITDIPADAGELTFRVTPYIVAADGTVTYGQTSEPFVPAPQA